MISRTDLDLIGRTIKPHGINGELAATIDGNIEIEQLRCIVFDIDGIYVPFFINSYRTIGSEAVLLKIDGIDNENEAADICGQDIYALRSDINIKEDNESDDGVFMSDIIGYALYDTDNHYIGIIDDYDDSTANTLLIVQKDNGSKIFVPIADDLVDELDIDDKRIILDLPEGLLDL